MSHAIADFCNEFDDVDFRIYTPLPLEFFNNIPADRFRVIASKTFISNDIKPTDALRNGAHSSMGMAIKSIREGVAHAVVSGGNTGALMAMSKVYLKCIDGIKRPAIMSLFPTAAGSSVILDLGANIECTEEMLYEFAMMGSCFAKIMLNKKNPSVALLNVGKENIKGRTLEQKTHKLLEDSILNFIGYVEGHDLALGAADVVVTDGFSGNLVLKASEGAASMMIDIIKNATRKDLLSKIGGLLLKNSLKSSLKVIDPSMNNGAMFAGINGIVIKSHGGASVKGIINAFRVARTLAAHRINHAIKTEFDLMKQSNTSHSTSIFSKIKTTSAKIFGSHVGSHAKQNDQTRTVTQKPTLMVADKQKTEDDANQGNNN